MSDAGKAQAPWSRGRVVLFFLIACAVIALLVYLADHFSVRDRNPATHPATENATATSPASTASGPATTTTSPSTTGR